MLAGVYYNKELQFVAKVKNGFVPRIRDDLFPALKALQTARCPFKNLPEKSASRWGESLTAEKMDQCRWVKPKLVCQIAFVEWTDAEHLRHCTFVGIRDDKRPAEVVRETCSSSNSHIFVPMRLFRMVGMVVSASGHADTILHATLTNAQENPPAVPTTTSTPPAPRPASFGTAVFTLNDSRATGRASHQHG